MGVVYLLHSQNKPQRWYCPMETGRQEDLEVLGQRLQEQLALELPDGNSFEVRCAAKDGTLLVLSQHPSHIVPDQQQTFKTLQQALQSLQPETTQPVQLFLRVAGQRHPYGKYSFTLFKKEEGVGSGEQGDVDASATLGRSESAQAGGENDEFSLQALPDLATPHSPLPLIPRGGPEFPTPHSPLPTPLLIGGATVGLIAFLGGGYLLTRPCVIGGCAALQTAQQLSQESPQMLRQANSPQQLLVVEKRMGQASDSLKAIPNWSPHHTEATELLQTLSTQSAAVDQVVTAFENAYSAAVKSQKPPHTVQEWRTIQGLWGQAIKLLNTVPNNSPLAPLVQKKLPQYRANLELVNQQLNAEQQGMNGLKQAKVIAQAATVRQNASQSVGDWVQVQSSWQEAVNGLVAVPVSATAYKEAQELLPTYQTKLAATRDRATKEKIAANLYNQATSLANLAKTYEQQNQWAFAVANWSQALNAVQQIPTDTFYANPAQPLVENYTESLKAAQEKNRVASILQKASADLNRTCSGAIQICTYAVTNDAIKVYIASGYDRTAARMFYESRFRGDYPTFEAVALHVRTLLRALAIISDNTQLPLHLYDSDGSLIGTHLPGRE